jgi:Tetratricopeptide repeat
MTFLFVGSQVCRGLPPDAPSRRRPCLRLVVATEFIDVGSPTGDLHPINSRPCRAYTLACTRRLAPPVKQRTFGDSHDPKRYSIVEEMGNQISLSQDHSRRRAPWSPTGIALISVLFSPLPGGILHALNYSRLGQPGRQGLALTSNLITTAILFLAFFFASGRFQFLVLIVSILIAAYFYKSQEHLFRQYRSTGGQKASLLLPAVLSVIAPVILALGLSYAEDLRYQARFKEALRMMEAGKYAEAERGFRACQEAYPDDVASYWNLAVIYDRSGDLGRAKQELKAFLAKDPGSKEVREYLGRLESIKQ